ncbi:MAG: DUF4176 domain-containing protein [Oscillospiraceae bacterium]
MFEGLLPIGSVVLLKDSTKKVFIIGVCQQDTQQRIWDYVGAGFPEGYIGPDKTYLFNDEQIDKVFAVGYQDEEQFGFKLKADAVLKKIRESNP